jgi:hypothetical protein
MIAAAVVGIFVIPMLYVVFQRLRERVSRRASLPNAVGEVSAQRAEGS